MEFNKGIHLKTFDGFRCFVCDQENEVIVTNMFFGYNRNYTFSKNVCFECIEQLIHEAKAPKDVK